MMLRSIDLLLQSSTRSRCYVRNKVKLALGHEPKDFLVLDKKKQLLAVRMSSLARTKKKRPCQLLWAVDSSNALKCRIQLKTHSNTHTQLIVYETRVNHTINQKKMHLAVTKTRKRQKTFISRWPRATWCNCYVKIPSPKKSTLDG